MEQYHITAKEFIYLCLNAGAKKVYGIENEFKNVREENLMTEFSNVQKELIEKRYMRMDFDGNVTIKKKVLEEIEICALCDRAVMFTASGDKGNKKKNYYFKGDEVVSLIWSEGNYLLEKVDQTEVFSMLWQDMSIAENMTVKEKISLSVKQNDVQKALKERDIRKYGCYSLVQMQKNANKRIQNLLFLETNKGILSVKSRIVDLDNALDVESCSMIEVKHLLQKMLK